MTQKDVEKTFWTGMPGFLKDWLRFNKLLSDFKKMFTFAIL